MKKILSALILPLGSMPLMAGILNLVEPNVSWSNPEVRVCFANYSQLKDTSFSTYQYKVTENSFSFFSDEQKLVIKNIVTKEYTPERTGIHFVGWNDCQSDPQSDVYIFNLEDKDQYFTGTASLGESGLLTFVDAKGPRKLNIMQRRKTSKKNYIAFNTAFITTNTLSFNEKLEMVSLHEFGHVAGLRHEHADKNITTNKRFNDLNCIAVQFEYGEKSFDSTTKSSVYDANSIMNYCYMYLLEQIGLNYTQEVGPEKYDLLDSSVITKESTSSGINHKIRIGLSQGDLHALGCLYQYDKKTKKAICKETYDPKTQK